MDPTDTANVIGRLSLDRDRYNRTNFLLKSQERLCRRLFAMTRKGEREKERERERKRREMEDEWLTGCVGSSIFDGSWRRQRPDAGRTAAGGVAGAQSGRRLLDGGRIDCVLTAEKIGWCPSARTVIADLRRSGRWSAITGRGGCRSGRVGAGGGTRSGTRGTGISSSFTRLATRRGSTPGFRRRGRNGTVYTPLSWSAGGNSCRSRPRLRRMAWRRDERGWSRGGGPSVRSRRDAPQRQRATRPRSIAFQLYTKKIEREQRKEHQTNSPKWSFIPSRDRREMSSRRREGEKRKQERGKPTNNNKTNQARTSVDLRPRSRYVAKTSSYFCVFRESSISVRLYPIPTKISIRFRSDKSTSGSE